MYKVWTWSQQGNRRTEDGRQKRDRSLGWIWNAKVKAAYSSCIVRSGRTSVLRWTKQNQNQIKAELFGGLGASRTAGTRKRGSPRRTVGGVEEKTNSRR
jgi:hypothetical protein